MSFTPSTANPRVRSVHRSPHKEPIPITTHERVLLGFYRALTASERGRIDEALWRSWWFEGTVLSWTPAARRRRDEALLELAGTLTPGDLETFAEFDRVHARRHAAR